MTPAEKQRLADLEGALAGHDPLGPFWGVHAKTIDPDHFRASPHFIDARGYPYQQIADILAGERVVTRNRLAKLDGEDGAFGVEIERVQWPTGDPGLRCAVSRNLLDSALEIDFLEGCLGGKGLEGMTILDIGAGYGRLAHRITSAVERCFVYCADVVPLSTVLCERYLAHRKVTRAAAVALPELRQKLAPRFNLAMNVHSWSECTLGAIRFWLQLLDAKNTRALFLVPHHEELRAYDEAKGGGLGESYRDELELHGWRETARSIRKLEAPARPELAAHLQGGWNHSKYHYLFQRWTP